MGAVKKLTYSAILLALLLTLLFIKTISPTNQLSLYMVSSFIIGIVVIETDINYAWIFYGASILLTLILPVDKLSLMLYYTFFGIYGLVKFYIEKIKNLPIELIIKVVFFISIFYLNYLLAKSFIPFIEIIDKNFVLLLIAAAIVFAVYDYVYTLFIVFYNKKIHKHIRRI